MEKSIYDKLIELKNEYPELTFNNDGYEYLSRGVKDAHKAQIAVIEVMLEHTVPGFVRFDNFKPKKNGSFDVRMQTMWSEYFTGVQYNDIEYFKDK